MIQGRARTPTSDLAYYDVPATNGSVATPLLLVQGFAADHLAWSAQVAHFSDRRTITFDARGLGASTGALSFGLDDLAADALAVLDAAGVAQADVMGLSMGGAVALHLALLAPERVRKLVLASTMAALDGRQRAQIQSFGELYPLVPAETFFRLAYSLLFTPRFFERRRAFEVALRYAVEHAPPAACVEAQARALLAYDVRDRLSAIGQPALVVHGVEDAQAHVERGRELARGLPAAQLVELEGVGHSVNLEGMAAFHRAVRRFLDTTDESRNPAS